MSVLKMIAKRPDTKPYVTNISDTLENLQKFVGGYIEVVSVCSQVIDENGEWLQPGMAIICNEEGRLKDFEYNCEVDGVSYVGDILFVGTKGDEFCDIPVDFQEFKRMFPELWEEVD